MDWPTDAGSTPCRPAIWRSPSYGARPATPVPRRNGWTLSACHEISGEKCVRKRALAAPHSGMPRGGARVECPHDWGHDSLKGYATMRRQSAPRESSRREKNELNASDVQAGVDVADPPDLAGGRL